MNAPFATNLLGWKKLERTSRLVPNNADSDSTTSKLISRVPRQRSQSVLVCMRRYPASGLSGQIEYKMCATSSSR